MAHQAHNLPWITLASHLKFVRDNKRFTPHKTDLFSTAKDSELNDVNHFVNQLCKTLGAFATTERAKYPKNHPVAWTGPLFASSVLDENLPWIVDKNTVLYLEKFPEPRAMTPTFGCDGQFARNAQLVENWTARKMDAWGYDNPFNEMIALLIDQNQVEALLRIAQHPAIDTTLIRGGNYCYPYEDVARDALLAYVVLNVVVSKPELCTDGRKDYMEIRALENALVSCSAHSFGQDLAHIGHRKFIGLAPAVREDARRPGHFWRAVFDPLADMEALRDWMKHCFEVMVRYEMFEREAGRDPLWRFMFGTLFVGRDASAFGLRGIELDDATGVFVKAKKRER